MTLKLGKRAPLESDESLKLGKRDPQWDVRNLRYGPLMKPTTLPDQYDCDGSEPIPTPMFANDQYGCCVISGRAHQTLRFERREQKKLIEISDTDVIEEYLTETGGDDSGLYVLKSLKRWRKGWDIGDCRYRIKAFARLTNPINELKHAIYADLGVGLGLQLPMSALDQFDKQELWDVVDGVPGLSGSWGGHYVYVVAYDKFGPICVTWGARQPMTWAFLHKYCDEAYSVFDAENSWKRKLINKSLLESYLRSLSLMGD